MSKAVFSPNRQYRYELWRLVPVMFIARERTWPSYVQFIGLNPSTADEVLDDPTIRKCRGFASRWGFTRMCMTNLFALRATKPAVMKKHQFPIGEETDAHMVEAAKGAGLIVCCWGNGGSHLSRGKEVLALLRNVPGVAEKLHSIGELTNEGQPWHPLYIDYKKQPLAMKEDK